MKTLYLMRHAQKEIDNTKDDYDIELTQEGITNTINFCKKLKEKNITIDMILTSPATRAEQTAQIIAEELNYDGIITRNEVIYKAFLNELLETLSYTYDNINSLFMVGHNPAIGTLAFKLTKLRENFEMGSIARIDFDCDSWLDINEENAKLIYFEKGI
ncbi:phosphoglycerate mutase [Malaciobacter molluscorum LMG 25693]|uniref:Phosphoglycerate mutase n=1 Tax=Malaciobacter molluscorum LMG 25693 TaxID=870501 RepID=A0A2G1DHU0_9BACT|nr:histidine phosphatase family protein [Malaciobacter molluscorum]AXX92994.1 phosphohistidine phosphatase [Malaciobacter molluscorum LMG 25693]PHO18051.1 phosphoglycerate mutase [Malaciobacter molluscorum LMG 25693]